MNQNSKIIFVCEHGAAKSIIAAAYFNKLAQEIGLDQQAIARGTNPDPELSQTAVEGLRQDGLIPDVTIPQELSSQELQTASQVIAFCKLLDSYGSEKVIEYWDDVPPVSQHYETARDDIVKRIKQFINIP
jgi:arsenate reductase (thioredoxin)